MTFDELLIAFVVDLGLDRIATLETEDVFSSVIVEVGGYSGLVQIEIVDVDGVIVEIEALEVLEGVEFDDEDEAGEVVDVAGVEDAEVLAGLGPTEAGVGEVMKAMSWPRASGTQG